MNSKGCGSRVFRWAGHLRLVGLAAGTLATGAGAVTACSSTNAASTTDAGATHGNDSGQGGSDDAGLVAEPAPPPTVAQPKCHSDPANWPMFGQNVCNTASSPTGAGMSKAIAKRLAPKWVYSATGEVSATPAVVDGFVYVPDWGGMISKLDAKTGKPVWSKSVTSIMVAANKTTLTDFLSRTTPLVTADSVIFGTGRGSGLLSNPGPSAFLVAISKDTGALKWFTPVHEDHPAAVIVSSPVYDGKTLYFGVASSEEAFPLYIPGYACCSFRGSVFAINAADGTKVWQHHTISDALYKDTDGGLSGYAGAAVWSSTPVIDSKRSSLYVTLGNNYTVPAGAPGSQSGDNPDSIIALDLATGTEKWATPLPEGGRDVWTYANIQRGAPDSEGFDSDFGCGANFFTAMIQGVPKDLVGAGQKSGVYFALDADDGKVIWQTQVTPGAHLAGIHWGTATDGNRIYVGANNSNGTPMMLKGNGPHHGEMVTTGTWAALNPSTGEIMWQVADPAMTMPLQGATVNGPVTVVNGVLFGGSMDAKGTMFALDADTGEVLWSFQSGGTVYGGAAIVGGTVFWGSGYPTRIGFGTSSKKLYAFAAK